jgi:hypothetical protein
MAPMEPVFLRGRRKSVGAADGLGVVFDDIEVMASRDVHDLLHRCGMAVEVNGDDGFGLWGDGGFQRGRVHAEGAGSTSTKTGLSLNRATTSVVAM